MDLHIESSVLITGLLVGLFLVCVLVGRALRVRIDRRKIDIDLPARGSTGNNDTPEGHGPVSSGKQLRLPMKTGAGGATGREAE